MLTVQLRDVLAHNALLAEQAAMERYAALHDHETAQRIALEHNRQGRAEWVYHASPRGSKWAVERRRRCDDRLIDIL